jgi:triosephosphate isomerase
MRRRLITAEDVAQSRTTAIPPGAILTPLARDLLRARGVDTSANTTVGPTPERLVIANWKSHKTVPEALEFANAFRAIRGGQRARAGSVICAPFTALHPLGQALRGAAELGAQDVSPDGEGAHTGEVAARHLVDVDCRWVIVGHSERRAAGEDDALVRRKLLAAVGAGLRPVLCVGETLQERRAGRAEVVVSDQLRAACRDLDADRAAELVVAYEPRWAIGTGVTPQDDEIVDMLAHARQILVRVCPQELGQRVPVLYGGSVKPSNAATILHLPGCAGALVGGASLKADSFAAILAAC